MLPPISLAYASFGHGHAVAARSVGEALRAIDPAISFDYVDVLPHLPAGTGALLARSYRLLASRAPRLWGFLYYASDGNAAPLLSSVAGVPFRRLADRHLAPVLAAPERKLVLCTHPFAAVLVRRHFHARGLPRVWVVLTDLRAHAGWAQRGVERFFVPSDEARADLVRLGISDNSITLSGMPVRPRFPAAEDDQSPSRPAGAPRRFTVLLMPHWHHPALEAAVLRRLVRLDPPPRIIAVAGSDDQLRRALEREANSSTIVYGWVDDVPRLMDACDIVVTKPGGQTVAEAIAAERPLVLIDPIPGPEELNAAYVAGHGLGVLAHSADEVARQVHAIGQGDPASADRRRYGACYRAAARRVAKELVNALGTGLSTGGAVASDVL